MKFIRNILTKKLLGYNKLILTDVQQHFIDVVERERFSVCIHGRRVGASTVSMHYAVKQCVERKGVNVFMVGEVSLLKSNFDRILASNSRKEWAQFGITKVTKNSIQFDNMSTLHFVSISESNLAVNFRGYTIDLIIFDDITRLAKSAEYADFESGIFSHAKKAIVVTTPSDVQTQARPWVSEVLNKFYNFTMTVN